MFDDLKPQAWICLTTQVSGGLLYTAYSFTYLGGVLRPVTVTVSLCIMFFQHVFSHTSDSAINEFVSFQTGLLGPLGFLPRNAFWAS